MSENYNTAKTEIEGPDGSRALKRYQQPSVWRASWQLANTLVPYLLICTMMVFAYRAGVSYGLILVLAVVAAALLVRIFIFLHDCAHNCFLRSRKANAVFGNICGILTFTPYEEWRKIHGIHHNTYGDLDRRSEGDVWILTTEEYKSASKLKRFLYRFYRNPFILLGLGPLFLFLVSYRIPRKGARKRQIYSVIWTNTVIFAIILTAGLTIGFKTYILVQFPVIFLAGITGVWLFYIQHQFEGAYWARHDQWDWTTASVQGSSYYKLPKVLQWVTGNIGLHHVHHLRPRIPNYNLQQCLDESPSLAAVKPLTLFKSFKCLRLKLWDENKKKLVGFGSI